jgi:MATE family multidrug resistance protein
VFTDARRIAALAWPVLIGQLAIIAFSVIDTAMVGRYSALDLAALGLGASIYISVFIGLTGILTALQPIAAQLYGAGHHTQIGEEVRQGLWLAFALAIIGFIILYFPAPLLDLAHARGVLREHTIGYLRLLSFGLPASLIFRLYSSLANALGRPHLVMAMQVGALVLKVPLNAWLIFGGMGLPALGGPGCALVSTALNWLCATLALLALARLNVFAPLHVFRHFSWPRWQHQKEQLRLGLPIGLCYLIEVTTYTFMALFIARFGATTLAGHQIASNLGAVIYMTPLSIGIATSTLVAQALGAQRAQDAHRLAHHGIMLSCAIACVYCVAVFTLRASIIRGYTPNPAVAAAAMPLVMIVAGYHLFDALQVTSAFVLRAYKVVVAPTVIYALALWGVGLGGGYLLGFNVGSWVPSWASGARGFWLASAASLMIAGCGLLVWLSHVIRRSTHGLR